MKGLYQCEIIKDIYFMDEDKGRTLAHKKGEIVWVYGYQWLVDMMGMANAFKNPGSFAEAEFFDMNFFKIWIPDKGWHWVQDCHFKPMGAKLNKPGIC